MTKENNVKDDVEPFPIPKIYPEICGDSAVEVDDKTGDLKIKYTKVNIFRRISNFVHDSMNGEYVFKISDDYDEYDGNDDLGEYEFVYIDRNRREKIRSLAGSLILEISLKLKLDKVRRAFRYLYGGNR